MQKSTILIIDDEAIQRKTLADILHGKGYEVLTAENGTNGLSILDDKDVNLAIIDLCLPDISGLTVLERMKAKHPRVEAIILTGNATVDSAIEASNMGAFSYLVKPFEVEHLLLSLDRAIKKQHAKEQILRHRRELERTNAELQLHHQVSMAISKTMDLQELLSEVLQVLVNSDILHLEPSAAALIAEGDRLRLIAHLGFSNCIMACNNIRVGQCICGYAALTGELTVSSSSVFNLQHNILSDKPEHRHIALPLKSMEKVLGVMMLKTQPLLEVDEQMKRVLSSLGNHIAIAVNNAKLYQEAKSNSLQDTLTGLANRRALQMQMTKSIEAAKRYNEKLSVVMLDIDHFKNFNDKYGHVEGDRLLVKIADIIAHETRSSDHVFRYGGEEFLVLLPQTDTNIACEVAERVRKSVESATGVTISLGVSSYQGCMWDDEGLIKTADAALYQAKRKGRNRVVAGI